MASFLPIPKLVAVAATATSTTPMPAGVRLKDAAPIPARYSRINRVHGTVAPNAARHAAKHAMSAIQLRARTRRRRCRCGRRCEPRQHDRRSSRRPCVRWSGSRPRYREQARHGWRRHRRERAAPAWPAEGEKDDDERSDSENRQRGAEDPGRGVARDQAADSPDDRQGGRREDAGHEQSPRGHGGIGTALNPALEREPVPVAEPATGSVMATAFPA